jgi:hypothetical protein
MFTDTQAPEDQRPRVRRRVYEDELAVAVEAGGSTSSRAKAAVITYRANVTRDLSRKLAEIGGHAKWLSRE